MLRAALHYGSPLFGYVLALILIFLTGAFRVTLIGPATFIFPFIFFYPAIALVAFLGGAGPGLAATVGSALFAILFFPLSPAPPSWLALAVLAPLLVAISAHVGMIRIRNKAMTRELLKFKFIDDHANDWILLLNESGVIQYANHKAARDLGWTQDELIGRSLESFAISAHRAALRSALEKAKSGTATPTELAFECRTGASAPVELGCTAVYMDGKQVIHAAARDIGERKQIEKKLQEIRHWESLGALAGGLAHDFNNLLTAILGNASLARDYLPRNHEVAPMLDAIVSSAENSSDLVKLLFAAGGFRSHSRDRLELDQLLDWTLAHHPLPARIKVAKEIAKDAEHKPLRGDRQAFETLFASLIANAAEAYGDNCGEVRVAIRSGVPPIPSAANFDEGDPGPGECLGIVVEDRGSGMAPEILERAFDPFFSTRFTGRGLGLPAVRGIVRAYSGKLSLRTAEGEGTRVEVWLPVSKD